MAAAILPICAANAQVVDGGQTAALPAAAAAIAPILPAGAPIVVALTDDLSSATSQVGDRFNVVVVYDVLDRGIVVIPKGTTGIGEVTFSTKKGAFGRAGLLGIALRTLDLNGKSFELDGRYREEGKDNGAAAGAMVFAVGVFGAVVSGKTSIIPKGRELKAHTGEDIPYVATIAEGSPTQPQPVVVPATAVIATPVAAPPAATQLKTN